MVSEECPFCHKFLASELLSRREVDTSEVLKEKDVFFKMGIPVETGERMVERPDAFTTYKFTYRCKNCGREWSSFKVEESGGPRELGGEEEDEVEADGDVEDDEEEAGEEQFAEE